MIKHLDEIVSFFSGNAWKAASFKESGKLPIIRIQNIGDNKTSDFVYWDDDYNESYLVNKGDLLLSLSGSIKLDFWQGEKGLLNQRIVKITPREKIHAQWLYYQLLNYIRKIELIGNHALVNNVSLKDLKDIRLNVPPIEAQIHIANILSKAEALIAQRKESLRLLDEFLKSTFLEMFGDPVKNDKAWKMLTVSEIGESRLGKMLDGKKVTGKNLKPYLRNSNVLWFKFKLDDLLEMDFDEKDRLEFGLEFGDVLMCEGGEIGRCAIWKDELQECYFQKAIHRIRLYKELVLPEYFVFMFWVYTSHGGLKKFMGGATISHLTGDKLKKIKLPIPPISLQRQFLSIVEKTEALKKHYQQSLEELENLYGSLSQRAFRGELELPEPSSSSASFLKAATAHVESMHYAKEHKDNAPVVAQAQQKTYYTPREVIRLINSLDSVRLNIPEEGDRIDALDRPFPFKDSKARYFSFTEIEELIKHSDWQAEYSYLREEFFMLFRQGKLRQVYADAEFKAGFNEQHPQYQEVQALEEKMYLQFVGFIIS